MLVAIGRLGGWARLAREYPARPLLGGRRFRFQSSRMRFGTGYGCCLTLGSDPSGLHLSILFLFRAGHAPAFFPWSEVSVEEGPRRGVSLRFARVPGVPLVLSRRLVTALAEASAGGLVPPPASRHGAASGDRRRDPIGLG